MEREDISILVLAFAAILVLIALFFFRWIIDAIMTAIGIIACCLVTLAAIVAFIILVFSLFSAPFVAVKNPKKEYYGDYRIEDIKGMDEDEENHK